MNLETLITIGYYISLLSFLVASIMTFQAANKAGQSGLKNVLLYLFIGTWTFFAITIFQKLGGDFFGIADESMDIWWHIMFYLAMLSYYFGFKSLVKLGNTEVVNTQEAFINGKNWGIFTVILLAIIFITPNSFESVVSSYTSSRLGEVGAHHFIALVVSGVVGAYLFGAKAFLGQLGRAIASPMLIAVWALSFLHFWELLAESWKVIEVSDDMIEGVEKIFLTITAICIIYAANRLKAMSQS